MSIDALVETADGTILYSGIIQDYLLSKQGGLELLYLTQVTRRYFKNYNLNIDQEDSTKIRNDDYYYIPGDFVVLPFKEIKNINISYYSIEDGNSDATVEETT